MPVYERISVVVSLTLIGVALYFVIEFPAQVATFNLFGSPVTLTSPRQWLMALLLAGLVMAGTDAVIRSHPALPSRRFGYLVTFWPLPGLLVILATQTLGLAPSAIAWAVWLMVVGLLLWLTILAEFRLVSPAEQGKSPAHLWQQFIGFAITLALLILIYQTRSRSAISATEVVLVSGLAALALLRQRPEIIFKTWLFAGVIGLSLGQITWAMNYWRSGTRDVGLLLLLVFYVLVGLARQQLATGRLSRRALWEFGGVTVITLLVILNL